MRSKCARYRRLSIRRCHGYAFVFLALVLCLQPPLEAQSAVRAYQNIPRYAISRESGLILAQGGVARFYDARSGVSGAEFLDGVYKSFGLSPDARSFLFLKAAGGFPTFELYLHELETGAATRVTLAAVHHAAWSPDGKLVAYQWLDSSGQLHVSLYNVATRESTEAGWGRLKMDYLEWAPDSSELLYLSIAPSSGNAFETGEWDSTLHRYSLRRDTTETIPGVDWAQFSGGQLMVSGGAASAKYKSIPNPAHERIERFVIQNGEIFANLRRNGRDGVSRWNAAEGSYEAPMPGRLVAAAGNGVLIRDFSSAGGDFRILQAGGPLSAPAAANWRLPYYGRASLVQGGSAYSGGACDGAVCDVVAHTALLNFGLDFEQVSEINDGNQHMLAVESGTVVNLTAGVACNSVPGCTASVDPYTSPCNDPNSGAGNYVIVAHLDGTYSLYAHLRSSSIQVTRGQAVAQGTYLGDQGHSGGAYHPNHYRICGDHLHFQRQTGPVVWSQAVPTDFENTPCLMACYSSYLSNNVELAPAPALNALQPASGLAGGSVAVSLSGSDFLYGTTLTVGGAGVTGGAVAVNSATQATATLVVAPGAALGPRDVTLTTARGMSVCAWCRRKKPRKKTPTQAKQTNSENTT